MDALATVGPAPSTATTGVRVEAVDVLRGAAMVLMAIDHVRVYAAVPAGGPDAAVFFTRWVTHFCAPVFVFLAGSSAFLYGRAHAGVGRFLLTRGIWLVLLELTLLRVAWTFNLEFMRYNLAGVIWVIGISMVLMAPLVRLPLPAVAAVGLAVVGGHNLLDGVVRDLVPTLGQDAAAAAWKILYVGFYAGPLTVGVDGPVLWVLYSIVPWVGVMAAGYAFGRILTLDAARRDRLCLRIGLACLALFAVLRGLNLYGDPQPWSAPGGDGMPAVLSFLNTTKYPASLAFLLMTLGPAIALVPACSRARGAAGRALAVFGRVPLFYYLLHIPLVHVLAIAVSIVTIGEISPWLFGDHPLAPGPPPDGYMWGLPLLYAVWAVAVALLYVASRWFAGVKSRRREWWLKYL
jgi:uncharacterized membrane protein